MVRIVVRGKAPKKSYFRTHFIGGASLSVRACITINMGRLLLVISDTSNATLGQDPVCALLCIRMFRFANTAHVAANVRFPPEPDANKVPRISAGHHKTRRSVLSEHTSTLDWTSLSPRA